MKGRYFKVIEINEEEYSKLGGLNLRLDRNKDVVYKQISEQIEDDTYLLAADEEQTNKVFFDLNDEPDYSNDDLDNQYFTIEINGDDDEENVISRIAEKIKNSVEDGDGDDEYDDDDDVGGMEC